MVSTEGYVGDGIRIVVERSYYLSADFRRHAIGHFKIFLVEGSLLLPCPLRVGLDNASADLQGK